MANEEFDWALEGPIGTDGAVLMSTMGWKGSLYHVAKEGRRTELGGYEDVFELDGKYYISPYWSGESNWEQLTAEELAHRIARKELWKE